MPRTATNPNKLDVLAPSPNEFEKANIYCLDDEYEPDVTVAVLTHFTHHRYHTYRLPVVDLCINSIRKHIGNYKYELMIFDNGSTPDFKKHLRTYEPDVLILSPNLGKQTAQQMMLKFSRGKVFAFCDDDIYFYPNWLEKHMQILNVYPRPILVSGSPQRTAFRWGIKTNMEFSNRQPGIMQVGRYLTENSERQYARSIGRPEVSHILNTNALNDYLFEYQGVKAWGHAHHMQFVAWADDLRDKMPASHYLVDNAREWDMKMDAQGFLRMTTYERTSLHIGNELQGDVMYWEGKPQ